MVYGGKEVEVSSEFIAELERQQEEAAKIARAREHAPPDALRSEVDVDLSLFVESSMCWAERRPIDFTYRPWLPRIYDSEHIVGSDQERPRRRTLIKSARQCEKSTSLGNKMLGLSLLIPNVTALYVSSATMNAYEFADHRIDNTLRISPVLARMTDDSLLNNKFTKRFQNNSRIIIRAVHKDANRVRGIPGDVVDVDEIQDIDPDFLPVIEACTKNSYLPYGPILLASGTPLSYDNWIEQAWSKNSTQNVWLTRCSSCRHWNPPHPEQVGRWGMICSKCGSALDPLRNGQWVRMRTETEDVKWEGYHLSQVLMAYTRVFSTEMFESKWDEFYKDVHDPTSTEAQVKNELFGLSHDSGKKPITREQLIACCEPGLRMTRIAPEIIRMTPDWPVFAGIDWGEGTGEGGYTVVTLGYMNDDVMEVFFTKRYTGPEAEPGFVKKDLVELLESNKVDLCVCDAGYGWGMIDYLWDHMRSGRRRVLPMRYAGNQSQIIALDDQAGQFKANRTRWMARVFSLLLKGRNKVRLPRWTEYEPFGEDILNIFADRSPALKMMTYNHNGPDDSFHSLLYCLTGMLYHYTMLEDFAHA